MRGSFFGVAVAELRLGFFCCLLDRLVQALALVLKLSDALAHLAGLETLLHDSALPSRTLGRGTGGANVVPSWQNFGENFCIIE
jgi:hypothetical protein